MLRSVLLTGALAVAGATLAFVPGAPARAQCLLCAPAKVETPERPPAPLSIEVDASLDFSRATVGGGGGRLTLDPSGPARVSGDVMALGGMPMHGRVLVRGEPGRLVRVTMPAQVTLHTADGARAELGAFQVDLPAGARIGPDGTLRFRFGGELEVNGGAAGDYRGRIPITVDYP